MDKPLDPQAEQFIAAYIRHGNISLAGREVGIDRWSAQRLIKRPVVQDAIARLQGERLATLKAEGVDILREYAAIAFADPNELIEFRRGCCRHCWGEGFNFQHTTQRAIEKARKKYNATLAALAEPFVHGGAGFDPDRPPNPECPECFGDGVGTVFVKDTRYLSPGARALYAGVEKTTDGMKIKMHDKGKALEALGRHLSLFNDKMIVPGLDSLVARLSAGRKRAAR